MKKLFSYLSCMAFMLFLAYNANAQAKFEPPNGKCYIFVGQSLEATGGTNAQTDGYYDNVTNSELPVGFTAYTNPLGLGLIEPSNPDAGNLGGQLDNGLQAGTGVWDNDKCEANGVEFSLGSQFYQRSALNIGYFFTQAFGDWIGNSANRTQWDQNTRVMARFLHAMEVPVFLRIGYEFDFQYQQFGTPPSFYKETFRHIVDVIEDEIGVDHQIAFVFQSGSRNSYGGIGSVSQIENDWYPGDDYVDWVGISYFGNNDRYDFMTQLAVNHNKPLMICESAPKKDNLNEAWFNDIVSYIKQNDVIKAWSYINFDWDATGDASDPGCWPLSDQWGDSRVESDADILEFWENMINGNNHHLGTGDERWVTKWYDDGADNSIRYMQNPLGNGAFASFTATPGVVKPNETVTIVNNSLNGASYAWDFDDGNTSTSADPGTISYSQEGTYTIKLTVTDGSGGTNEATRTVKVAQCPIAHVSNFANEDELNYIRINDISGPEPGSDDGAVPEIVDGNLVVEMDAHAEFTAFIEIAVNDSNPIFFDYGGGDEVSLFIRAKASSPMVLRSTIVSDQGVTAQTNGLQLATSTDDNTFDLVLTDEYEMYQINFNGDLWDEWTGGSSIFCPDSDPNCPSGGVKDPIQFIHMKPNPAWNSNFFVTADVNGTPMDFDAAFEGTLTIDYVALGANPDSVCPGVVLDVRDVPNNLSNELSVFPVPASEQITVEVNDINEGTIEVISLMGEQLIETSYEGGLKTIDVSSFDSNAYLIKVTSAEGVATRKIQIIK